MGCSTCKNKNTEKKVDDRPLGLKVIGLLFRFILFIIASIVTSIIVIPFSVYMLFKTILLEEAIDFTGILLTMGGKLKRNYDDEDDDEDEFEFEDEDEIVLLDKNG